MNTGGSHRAGRNMEPQACLIPRQPTELDQLPNMALGISNQFLILEFKHGVGENAAPVGHKLFVMAEIRPEFKQVTGKRDWTVKLGKITRDRHIARVPPAVNNASPW